MSVFTPHPDDDARQFAAVCAALYHDQAGELAATVLEDATDDELRGMVAVGALGILRWIRSLSGQTGIDAEQILADMCASLST